LPLGSAVGHIIYRFLTSFFPTSFGKGVQR